MALDSKDWSSNANEALQIRLRHRDKSRDVSFNPVFTYPIFGEEESIFGYRGLKIRLYYTADTLKPSLSITWQQKYDPVGDTKADDVYDKLKEFLPSLPPDSESSSSADSIATEGWEPPGELVHQYEVNKRSYGIWSTTFSDPQAKELLRDIQVLILFFIEAGSTIPLDDPDWTLDRWRVFFIYEIDPSPTNPNRFTYSFVGYSTVYTLFFIESPSSIPTDGHALPDSLSTLENEVLQNTLPNRSRISQFLILPPHQGAGHGAHLYDTIVSYLLARPATREITVEDPNESFDDLRDFSDLIRLRNTDPAFTTLALNTEAKLPGAKTQQLPTDKLVSTQLLEETRRRAKIAPRQFARLAEMQLLSRIPPHHRNLARLTRKDKSTDPQDRAYYFWRLFVKQRIYKQNADQLAQLDLEERVEKLEETLTDLEKDYIRILDETDRRALKIAAAVAALEDSDASPATIAPGLANGSGRLLKRRKVIDEDDEDDDAASEVNGSRASSKRPRVSPER